MLLKTVTYGNFKYCNNNGNLTYKYSIRKGPWPEFFRLFRIVWTSHCFLSTMQKNKAKLKFCSSFVSANYVTETQEGYSTFILLLLCSSLIEKKSLSTNLPQFHLLLSFMHTQNWDPISLCYYISQYHA